MTYDVDMSMTDTRIPLTRERIIDAAVLFADTNGIDELSMRRLGAELGVEAMSLYNHVANKDEILDGMIDRVFSSVPLPDPDDDWRISIPKTGLAAMEQFTAHPWIVSLLMQRGNYGNASLTFMNQVLGILRSAGFDDEETHHAWQMLASHTMGYAFQSASGPPHSKEFEGREQELARLGDLYPHVAALAPLLAGCEFEEEYGYGLEIIIRGLEARLGSG